MSRPFQKGGKGRKNCDGREGRRVTAYSVRPGGYLALPTPRQKLNIWGTYNRRKSEGKKKREEGTKKAVGAKRNKGDCNAHTVRITENVNLALPGNYGETVTEVKSKDEEGRGKTTGEKREHPRRGTPAHPGERRDKRNKWTCIFAVNEGGRKHAKEELSTKKAGAGWALVNY